MSDTAEVLKNANALLEASGADSPLLDCYVLLSKASGKEILYLKAHPEYEINETAKAVFEELVSLRCKGMPVAYLTNEKEFYSLSFYVDTNVLIPRPDTECLVEKALEYAAEMIKTKKNLNVLDLCCGSGCIGIAFAANFEACSVTLSDISEKCVETAQKNIKTHSLENRVKATVSDLFDETPGPFDIIISNPPYVTSEEMNGLQREVKYEPEGALYGGSDGMSFYRSIIAEAADVLTQGGALVLETGAYQGEEVSSLLKANGFEEICTKKDLAGLQRCVSGRKAK